MKSKERHKLQHNVLADWIGKAIEWAKPYWSPILAGSLLVLLVLTAYFAWVRMSSASTTQAWTEVNTALVMEDVAKLQDVITHYPKTNAAYMAALVLGDSHLKKGCDDAFVDKTIANPELSKAIDDYSIVLEGSRVSSVREQATFGLAQGVRPRANWNRPSSCTRKSPPTGATARLRKPPRHRLEYLQQPGTKAFFDRFDHYNPRPALSSEPGAEKSGSGLSSLPGEPPITGPTPVKDLKLEAGKAQPGPAANPSSEEKPPTAKPAAEKAAAKALACAPAESKSPAKAAK